MPRSDRTQHDGGAAGCALDRVRPCLARVGLVVVLPRAGQITYIGAGTLPQIRGHAGQQPGPAAPSALSAQSMRAVQPQPRRIHHHGSPRVSTVTGHGLHSDARASGARLEGGLPGRLRSAARACRAGSGRHTSLAPGWRQGGSTLVALPRWLTTTSQGRSGSVALARTNASAAARLVSDVARLLPAGESVARATGGPRWSPTFGAEPAEEAAVVGAHELLCQPAVVVEPEDADQVHDNCGAVGRKRAGW
jgi:hypothetical protein